MLTMTEALQRLDNSLAPETLEYYIVRTWVRPVKAEENWYFEDIDIARIQLVSYLRQDMMVNDEGMDIVLHLLDQLYGMREQLKFFEATGRHSENRKNT